VVSGLISDVTIDVIVLLSQNLLQFPFSLTNKLFVTMRTPLSPVWLMVAIPPTSNISWVKTDRIISTTSAEQLSINVTPGLLSFVRYVCLVNNSAVIQQKSLLIKQKGANCSCTLLKMGCSKTPLGHYALLVIKKDQRLLLITSRA